MSQPCRSIDIITCEYPPDVGGVADHTRGLAASLAATGVDVHVWCPPGGTAVPVDSGVVVHELPDRFGPEALRALQHGLQQRMQA